MTIWTNLKNTMLHICEGNEARENIIYYAEGFGMEMGWEAQSQLSEEMPHILFGVVVSQR